MTVQNPAGPDCFTRFDLPTVIRDLLATAALYKVLDMADAFALGMDQGKLPDWESWDGLVESVCESAFAQRQSLTDGIQAHAAIVKKAEQYWQGQREAIAESAIDNDPYDPESCA